MGLEPQRYMPLKWSLVRSVLSVLAVLATLLCTTAAQAGPARFFVGVDSSPVLTSSDYQGLPNPNQGRLTFLFAHLFEDTPFLASGTFSLDFGVGESAAGAN